MKFPQCLETLAGVLQNLTVVVLAVEQSEGGSGVPGRGCNLLLRSITQKGQNMLRQEKKKKKA